MGEPRRRSFEDIFRVQPLVGERFATQLESFNGASFGGETLGCAALAAARTCADRSLHALHACFLRPIPPEVPIELDVERLSDGRRIARRRVTIRRDGRLLFELMASFAADVEGVSFQDSILEPGVTPPEEHPADEQVARNEGWPFWSGPLEWRWVGRPWDPLPGESSHYRAWVRPRIPLKDSSWHAAALAYLADFHSHWPVARKLRGHFDTSGYASLDQVVWIHRNLPWRDYWLVSSENDVAHGGRGFSRRTVHTRDGLLVATMAQEAIIPNG